MMDIKVSLSKSKFTSNPNNPTAAMLSTIIADKIETVNRDNIKLFANLVGKEGCTFCPATFKDGKRSKETFEQLQLLALDFDNDKAEQKISFDEVKERAEQYDLPMLFAYDALSSKNHNKFRVVFLNDVPIPDRIIAEAMLKALGTIFPEADPSCYKDVSKMYYGGKGVLHYDDNIPEINMADVFMGMTFHQKEKYKINHYKEKIARFFRETGIGLNKNGLLDITITEYSTELPGVTQLNQNGKKSPNTILYNLHRNRIGVGEIFLTKSYCIKLTDSSDTNESSVGKKTLKNHEPYRSSVLKDISQKCQLFQEFDTGSRKLSHDELLGIATNLIQVDTGSQKFRNVQLKHSHYYGEKRRKWEHDLAYMKQLDYRPWGCAGFCPHRKNCAHGTNILSTVKPKRTTMERIPGYKEDFDSVENVEKDVYRAIQEAYRANDKKWQVINAMTGIGKTTAFLKLMEENPTEWFLIAAPTNILKNQIYNKAVKLGLDVIKTPSLEEIKTKIPHKVWKHIQRLYKTGNHRSVHPYIHEILKKKDISCLQKYLKEREKLKNFGGSVITTHRYLLSMDEKRLREYDAVIIDEDIIFKSIISNQGEITISNLKKLSEEITDIRLAKKITKLLKFAKTESCIELDSFEWDDDDDDDSDGISTPFDIPSFCLTKKFYIRRASTEKNLKEDTVTFIKPVNFPSVKYIMVSATANEEICRKYFGVKNVNFYKCKQAEYEGVLYQYPGKSMSRTSIDNAPGIIERLMKRLGIDKVITFMKYGIGLLHFGNTEGSNIYEGKDMLVIGTPYHAEFLYKLVAFTMGFDFDEDAEMKLQLVTHNGHRFWFTTYEDENLRAIQFWMIENELEQAVGRARLLRNKCVVHLFSNFPLSQARIVNDFDYDTEITE